MLTHKSDYDAEGEHINPHTKNSTSTGCFEKLVGNNHCSENHMLRTSVNILEYSDGKKRNPSIYLSVCPSLSICLSLSLSVCLSVSI